jgi:hypothetical protein
MKLKNQSIYSIELMCWTTQNDNCDSKMKCKIDSLWHEYRPNKSSCCRKRMFHAAYEHGHNNYNSDNTTITQKIATITFNNKIEPIITAIHQYFLRLNHFIAKQLWRINLILQVVFNAWPKGSRIFGFVFVPQNRYIKHRLDVSSRINATA